MSNYYCDRCDQQTLRPRECGCHDGGNPVRNPPIGEVDFGATVDELVQRCGARIKNREECPHPRPPSCRCYCIGVRSCARHQLQVRLHRQLLRELRWDLPTDLPAGCFADRPPASGSPAGVDSLPRTRAAYDVYLQETEENGRYLDEECETPGEVAVYLSREAASLAKLREAFYEDTKHVNSRGRAFLVGDGDVKRMLDQAAVRARTPK